MKPVFMSMLALVFSNLPFLVFSALKMMITVEVLLSINAFGFLLQISETWMVGGKIISIITVIIMSSVVGLATLVFSISNSGSESLSFSYKVI